MRRLIVLALLAVASSAHSQNAPFVPVAVWYGGGKARAPMLEGDPASHRQAWRADLHQIKATGFNTVRCWIDWASAEPREREYHFEALDLIAELAQEEGLRVVVQVYVDSAPDWVGRKYADSHFVSIGGEVMPSNAAPGFCFDHPGVREAVLRLFTTLAGHLKTRPAFLGWDLWSEPHVINWAEATYMRSPEFCFCPYSVARFRGWLQKKYGSLDALNRAWYRRFESWDEVEPNRLSTILSYTDFIDWREFITQKLTEDLHMRFEAVKRGAPDRVATSHAAAPSLFTSPLSGDGSPDDWQMAGAVDFWGTSFYPKHSFPVGRDAAWRAALLDFTRSSTGDKGFWVGELQGGFGTVALRVSSTVTPSDLRMWMWSALARGAKGVNVYAWYPMSSGYESGGFGLINLDGTVTERARAAGAVARAVSANHALFAAAKPVPAEVAIVYNPLSYMVGGRRPLVAVGAQGEVANIERNSMLGTYRALFPTNVPVDFVHIDQIARGLLLNRKGDESEKRVTPLPAGEGGARCSRAPGEGRATSANLRYKVVFLPYPLMLSSGAAGALREFVAAGGTLVTEARAAWNDERGRAKEIIPGYGLHEVCGCRETAVQSTPSGKTEIVMSADFAGLKAGDRLRGSVFEETLDSIASNGRVIGRFGNGSPALVASDFGKGKMLAIGTFIGAPYENDRDENAARLLRGVLDWSGVHPRITAGASLEVRMLQSGVSTIVFAFNHATESVDATIAIDGIRGSARDVESGAAIELPLRHRFAANDAWVVEVVGR
jgi:beta-galactosidase